MYVQIFAARDLDEKIDVTPLVNSALGLDSWLVMRHGPSYANLSSTQRLGFTKINKLKISTDNEITDYFYDSITNSNRPPRLSYIVRRHERALLGIQK